MANSMRRPMTRVSRWSATRIATLCSLPVALVAFAPASGHSQEPNQSDRADCSETGVAAASATSAAELMLAAGSVREELAAERRHADWRVQRLAGTGAAIADPSSHLHGYGSYYLTDGASAFLRARCVSPRRATLLGASYGLTIGVLKEVADGYYTGFSAADLTVDAVGVGYSVAQQTVPVLRHIAPTFSLAPRALQGGGALTNYGAQTFWLSANVESLLPAAARAYWPSPVRVSLGRRAFQGGERDRIVLGLDLDPMRLPGNQPAWRAVKSALARYRLPGPAIELSPRVRAVGLYW